MAGRGLGGLFFTATVLVDKRAGTKFHDAAALVGRTKSEATPCVARDFRAWTGWEAAGARGREPGHGGPARGRNGWGRVLGNESAVRKSEWHWEFSALKRLHRCSARTRITMA